MPTGKAGNSERRSGKNHRACHGAGGKVPSGAPDARLARCAGRHAGAAFGRSGEIGSEAGARAVARAD